MKTCFIVNTSLEKGLPIYLKSVGCNQYQEHIVRKSGHPDYHYLHTLEGKGYLIVGTQKYLVDESTAFFLYPGVAHEYFAATPKWSTIWLTFNGPACDMILKTMGIKPFEVFKLSSKQYLEGILEAISNKASFYNYIVSIECSQLIYNFILHMALNLQNKIERNFENNYTKLLPIMRYIEENYFKNITLEELSRLVGLSPQHLCSIFKKTFQTTPYEYLIRIRIQKAKELLIKNPVIQVKEVCYEVGFKNPSYFCYMFKKLEGITPMQFKKLFG
ncbi:AraC family transcriptional regulator [Caldicellulosiruptor morganii]|uniref:AraC family transcriptional regulator n=1 Tax=Caldicellulosiruptor morganii TaxID=1387555 RepID=A0ABY7BJL9_9FIRM|nr:AraC family transcriptional regulator [Caldicellulosiruptor morganii]WAM33010.1 AraC family transcriptional regulator [Caldicellulosiruptor morganii]